MALGMQAQQFEANGLWYELTGKRTAQVISDPTDSVYRTYTEVVVPAIVRYEGRDYQVTRLDDQAFRYCHFLKSIQLSFGLVVEAEMLIRALLLTIFLEIRYNYLYLIM